MSKICRKCGVEKPDSEFNKNRGSKDGLFSWCRSCANEQSRNWYKANKDRARKVQEIYVTTYPDRVKATQEKRHDKKLVYEKNRYQKGKEFIESLKHPCEKCGDSRQYVIDFHHINPDEKKFNVSEGATGRSFVSIINEVEKCVCLCRNCHTEFHYLYGNLPEHPVEMLKEYLGVSSFNEKHRYTRDSVTCR